MEDIFISLLNISITASYLVLAIILLRLVFRKAPKWLFCLLWTLVGLRLVFPVSFESALSLIPSAETVPSTIIYQTSPHINSGIPAVNNVVNPIISGNFSPDPAASANPLQIVTILASWAWIAGLILMLAYALISFLRLKHRVSTATLHSDNIYQSEFVQSPFVLGLIKPKIYLPYNINKGDMGHVIAHENTHLRRKDHLIKPLAFIVLSVYWFNPVLWIAYILLCRDIELACDEKVIRELDKDERRDYSTALLNCSVNRRMIAACPLAFGEVGVKERIKGVMNYKKPAFWIIFLAVAVSIIATVCFMTNPKSDTDISGKVFIGSQIKYNYVKNHGISGIQYCITDDMVLYRFSGDNPGVERLGKLEKSDVTAQELTNQIKGQEKDYPNNPFYAFKSLKAAYATEKISSTEERARYYVVIDEDNAVLLVSMYDYLTMNEADYIGNVEQIDEVDGADYKNTFSSLIVRITKADYMGTSQVLETVQTYYWSYDEKGGFVELTDGLTCSTEGFDMSEGKLKITLNRKLEPDKEYEKVISVDNFELLLGEAVALRDSEKSGSTTYYSFDFIQENEIKYSDNLIQRDVHTDYNGVSVYLSDNSSLDGSIGYAVENRIDEALEMGEEFVVYRIVDGKAIRCDEINDTVWHTVLYQMSDNSTEYSSFNTDVYDISQPGIYRFEKKFSFAGEKKKYKMSFDFEILPTEESKAADSLDKAIEDAIASKYARKNDGSIPFVYHTVIANAVSTPLKGETKQSETVYVWFTYERYRVYSNRLENTGGGSNYAVLTFENTGGRYELMDYREPRDGSYHSKDIEEMFPDDIVLEPEKYSAQAKNVCYKKAISYFTEDVDFVYNVSFAYAGTSALAVNQFREQSENRGYDDKLSSTHYPVVLIESYEELEKFATDYGQLFNLGQSYTQAMGYPQTSLDEIPSFYDEIQKYNGEFFENNNLYIIYLSSDNSLVRHELLGASFEKNKLTFSIASYAPDTSVDKKLGYFMLVTLNKSAVEKASETDAYLAEEKTGKTYSCQKDGGDYSFTLRKDGTFDFVYSYKNAHYGVGEYTLENDKLIMTDNDGERFTFIKEREDIFVFDKTNSTSFHGEYHFPDGAAFEYVGQ